MKLAGIRILMFNSVFNTLNKYGSVREFRKNSKVRSAVRRAAILYTLFMQSKSRPAPPENEPVASDRRTAYL